MNQDVTKYVVKAGMTAIFISQDLLLGNGGSEQQWNEFVKDGVLGGHVVNVDIYGAPLMFEVGLVTGEHDDLIYLHFLLPGIDTLPDISTLERYKDDYEAS